MKTFTQKARPAVRPATAANFAAQESAHSSPAHFTDDHPAVMAQQALGESLNGSPAVQLQLQLRQAANDSPRVAALAKLSESLSGRQGLLQQPPPMQRQDAPRKAALSGLQTGTTALQAQAGAGQATGVVQRQLSPKAMELATRWQEDVLQHTTLNENSTERRNMEGAIYALAANVQLSPSEGDRELFKLISNYRLPAPDEDAIFPDVVPGTEAVARLTERHQSLLELLDQFINLDLDRAVEENIGRADREVRDEGDYGEVIRGVRGGTFTSTKDPQGALSPILNSEARAQILERAEEFNAFTGTEPPERVPSSMWITLYRRVKGSGLQSLRRGATLDEVLPFSTSWKRGFAEDWSPTEGVIFEIQVPVNYPALFQARRPGAKPLDENLTPLNPEQSEVTLIQSKLTLLEDPHTEPDSRGRLNFVVKVSATPLSLNVAGRQHEAMNEMSDEDRRQIAKQQRDEEPLEPDEKQKEIASGLAELAPQLEALYAAAARASPEQVEKVGKYVTDRIAKRGLPIGPASAVFNSFSILTGDDAPLLSTLLQRVFNPQYYIDSLLPPQTINGMLKALLGSLQQQLG